MKEACEITLPECMPLIFDVEIPSDSHEFSQAICDLKSLAKQKLFLWKDFPITLPESILNVSNLPVDSIFLAPEFDECEQLSKDIHGNLKPLNRHQLAQLRHTGKFDVDSSNFLGEVHTWQISSFFLKGTYNIRSTFKQDLYKALAVLVINAHDRIVGDTFSIRSGLFAFYHNFFRMAIDLFFGWPCVNHGDVDQKLLEERLRFITCELSVKSNQRKRVMDFWDSYEELTCSSRDTPLQLNEPKHPPYRFITPSRIPIDLRLHNSALLDRCLTVVSELRQPARLGWFQDFKEHAISRFQAEGKSLTEIKRLVRQQGLREYASRLFNVMRQDASLQSISKSIAEPLIQQATFSLILAEAKEQFTTAWLIHRDAADRELRSAHSILYHIGEWRSRQMVRVRHHYFDIHKFDVHEIVLSKCTETGLDQHAFFVGRDLTFLRERERLLRDQLEKNASFPDTQFIFRLRSQLLRHWKVYRKNVSYITNYEPVDTVLVSRRPSTAEPVPPIKRTIKRAVTRDQPYKLVSVPYQRSPPRTDQELGPQDFDVHTTSPKRVFRQPEAPFFDVSPDGDTDVAPKLLTNSEHECSRPTRSEYVVQAYLVYKASTRYFLWRWLAFLVCTYTWLLRSGQLFFITIPFRSAFSLTALVSPSPIYLKLELDHSTGYLFYNKSFYQDTLFSRIRRIWRVIRASRRTFDTTPSGGMLDKAAARPWHWLWSYVFRGFFGSLALVIVWPPLCILVSTLSIIIGCTLPIIVPLISLVAHCFGLLFWDAYKPASKSNRLFPLIELMLGHLLVRCLLQSFLALLTAFVLCPMWAFLRLLLAFVRFFTRSVWDTLVFHLVLRSLARVPAREDRIVRRIAGPGTASNHFYQARPVDILVILMGQLELLELRLWHRQMESLADKPMEAYRHLVQGLSWLSLVPKTDGDVYAALYRNTKQWRSEIQDKTDERVQAVQIHLKPTQRQRIKLSDRDLHHTLRMGCELTECFFHGRISPRLRLLEQEQDSWWSVFSLNVGDFLGLCTILLGRTFGEQIFTCITETDTVFPLQVREPALTRRFQEFMIDMVNRYARSVRSLNTVGLPAPSDSCLLHSSSVTGMSHREDVEEALSLASDAVAFPSDLLSQRCTVIAATPSKSVGEEAHISSTDFHTPLVLAPNESSYKGLAVSFVFPDTLKTTRHRAVPNPIAFVHIDLPLFPLSAFAPFSSRRLPLPLKSSPRVPSVDGVMCFSSEVNQSCVSCSCPTKADIDRDVTRKLVERWGGLPQSDCTCATAAHSGPACSALSGLTTLLVEEERDLRKQLSGWTWSRMAGSDFLTRNASDVSVTRQCPVHGYIHSNLKPFSFWSRLFGITTSEEQASLSPVIAAVEHLGRVYHPAIITLLMHSRDREHTPLDFTHPAIQMAVNVVTTPQKEFNLLHRLRRCATEEVPRQTDHCPAHLAASVGSQLTRDVVWERISSLKLTQLDESTKMFHPSSLFSQSSVVFDVQASQSALACSRRELKPSEPGASDTGLHYLLATSVHGIDSPHHHATPMNPMDQLENATVDLHNPAKNRTDMDPLHLFGWNDTSAVVGGYWSGTDTAAYETHDRDHSLDTPSGSLYCTEEAATTEDLEETEDALSLSSWNQCEFPDNLFTGSKKFMLFSNDTSNVTSSRPPISPLAVPELLTTSATTAGSADVEPLPEYEVSLNALHTTSTPSATSLTTNSEHTSIPNSVVAASTRVIPVNGTPSLSGMLGGVSPVNTRQLIVPLGDADHSHDGGTTPLEGIHNFAKPCELLNAELDNTDQEEDNTLKAVLML